MKWYWTASLVQRFSWTFGKPMFLFFLRFRTLGMENLKNLSGGVIFATNHQSEIDPILFTACFGMFSRFLPIYYVTKDRKSYRYNPFVHFLHRMGIFHLFGAYPAIMGIKNFERSLATHIDIIKRGNSVLIFPEGGIDRDSRIRQAKGGIIALANATKAPIVPVAIYGLEHVTPKDFFSRKRRPTVIFGKPIFYEEIFKDFDKRFHSKYKILATEKVMWRIEEMLVRARQRNVCLVEGKSSRL